MGKVTGALLAVGRLCGGLEAGPTVGGDFLSGEGVACLDLSRNGVKLEDLFPR